MMTRKRRIEPREANLSLVGGAQVAASSRREILKAVVVGRDRVQDSNALAAIEDREKLFAEAGAIEPPYDPESLCLLLEHSNSLRQNVDAYVTNIDGFGHRLEPAIDFEAEDVNEQIANAIYIESVARRNRGELPAGDSLEPTADEVAARKKELMHLARVERSRLDSFFDFCCSDHSFVTLRRRTRQDLEVLGNGFWEVLRNRGGEIAKLVHVPAYTVRLLPLDEEPVEVEERVRISPVSYDTVTIHRRFRRFVQIQGMGRQVFFKEFGDPRAVSKLTGRVFASMEELRETSAHDDGPATEMIHFAVHSPRSAYGVPRWIGTLLSVLGSRQMEEVNYLYFENKSVPPLAILISGGRLSKSSIPRIEDFIENHIKGKKNFHKCLILEAETTPNPNVQYTGKSQIKIEPLTQAQMHEELFGKYDERNMDKVGGSFRLPRLLRGESKDFNRACYDSLTETLTEQGWKRYHEIADGERIAAFNPETGKIEFHVPTARFVYRYSGEMIHFHGRVTDILVTPEHTMWVRPAGRDGTWQRVRADSVSWPRFDVLRVASKQRITASRMDRVRNIRRVPYNGMVYCFEVPNHLFVTRRNGKVTIQGNTAQAALRFSEEQVFQPERHEFDYIVNRKLFADMGICFWLFRSNSPVTRDPERMTEMVERLVKASVLTPEEGRLLAGDVFNRDFRVIKAPWVKQPVPLTLAGFSPEGWETEKADLTTGDIAGAGGLVPGQGGPPIDASFGTRPEENDERRRRWLLDEARRLLRIRDELEAEEARIAAEKLRLAREKSERGVETIRVPAKEFRSWFEPEDVRAMEDPVDE